MINLFIPFYPSSIGNKVNGCGDGPGRGNGDGNGFDVYGYDNE